MATSTIHQWAVEPAELSDGSSAFDVVGKSGEARVVFNCVSEQSAAALQMMLTCVDHVVGATAEAA